MSVGSHLLLLSLLSLSNGGEPPYYYGNGNFGEVYPTVPYQNSLQGVYSAPQPQYTPKGPGGGQSNWNPAMQYQNAPRNGNRYNQQSSPYGDGMGIRPQQPDDGMESRSRCPSRVYIGYKQIIDIQTSVQYGAQLLDGKYVSTFKECVDQCCTYDGCDLALYKTSGVSQTGKSCYFVHCGLSSHCKMVRNDEFQSGFLFRAHNFADPLDSKGDEKDLSPIKHTESPPTTTTTTITSSTSTTPRTTPTDPSNTTPPHTKDETESAAPDHDTTKEPPVFTDSSVTVAMSTASDFNTSGTEVSPFNAPQSSESISSVPIATDATGNSDHESSGENPAISRSNVTHTPPSKAENITTATNLTHNSTHKGGGENDAGKAKRGRDCSKDGCNGSGLIAFIIVGTLIMVLLLVAAAVVGRRIHKMRRRKKYRNVDYLINGMYT